MPFKWCFAGGLIVAQDVLSKNVCQLGYMILFIMRVNCMLKRKIQTENGEKDRAY